MTEQEAVAALKKLARQNKCAMREDTDSRVRHGHQFQDGFVIGWDEERKNVSFFAFSNSPVDPPKEVLEAFHGVRKVHIRPAERDLTWLRYMQDVRSLEVYAWSGQRFPVQWKSSEASLETFYLVTRTGKIPVQLRRFRELRSLGFNSQEPLELPGWLAQLTKLNRLFLRGCAIRAIPESLTQMGLPFVMSDAERRRDGRKTENLLQRGIFLDGAKLLEGDINLFRRRPEEIAAYYQKLRTRERLGNQGNQGKDDEPPPECMVVFLGDGAAGKTSLIDCIVNPDKPFEQGASKPTNGIKMERWPRPENEGDSLVKLLDGQPLVLRLRDFGGQEIMYSLHRCFMSSHTVYVVVCESRMDADIDINAARWVETVREFAPDSPVILALNKADLNPNVSVNIRDLQKRNPSLKYVLRTSAHSDYKSSVEDLLREVIREARQCADRYPAGADWLAVKKKLEDMDEDYITSARYKEICVDHNILNEDDQREMLDWFRDLGIVYSYSENKLGESGLETLDKTLHVLNPEWLSNGMYRIILRAKEGGFPKMDEIKETLRTVSPDDISQEIYEEKPGADEPKFIINVMRQFGISRKLDENRELIPVRLVKTPPQETDKFPRDTALHLRWSGSYLPNNLVHQLIIRKFNHLKWNKQDRKYCVWRTGGWFYEEADNPRGSQALVEMNERHIDLYVANEFGQDRRAYLKDMRDAIQNQLWDLNLKSVKEWLFWKDGGRIEYRSLIAQYITSRDDERREGADVFISGANQYVKPRRVLDTFYVNTDELVARYAWQEGISSHTLQKQESEAPVPARRDTRQGLLEHGWELLDVFRAYPWLALLPIAAGAGLAGILLLI